MIKNKSTQFNIGLVFSLAVILMILAGLFLSPYGNTEMDAAMKFAGPSFKHIFGCDNFGRDIFTRATLGATISIGISLAAVVFGGLTGAVIGAMAGYFGGVFDEVVMRITDVLFSIPSLLLALLFVSLSDSRIFNIILALSLSMVPSFVKMIRQEFKLQKEMDYVKAMKLYGAGDFRIIFVHIMPNVYKTLINCLFIAFNNCILAEAGLSFVGLGVQQPMASLGKMLSEANGFLLLSPHMSVFPGIFLILILLGPGLISEGGSFYDAYRKRFKN